MEKSDSYIGLGAGYFHNYDSYRGSQYPSSQTPDVNLEPGLNLLPEIDCGFKLRNGNNIDIALIRSMNFILYDPWKDFHISKGKDMSAGNLYHIFRTGIFSNLHQSSLAIPYCIDLHYVI